MIGSKSLVSMLAVGGLFLAAQQVSAAIVAQDNAMLSGGLALNATEYFGFGGPSTNTVTADDGNTFAATTQLNNSSGAGFSHHVPIADVTAVQPLVDGMAVRMSIWAMSDPINPWIPIGSDGIKMEFYNTALGAFGTADMTIDTEVGFGLGLSPVGATVNTSGWQQFSFTAVLTDLLVDFASLAEIRPVLFEGDFTGASPAATSSGRLFADGLTLEVFPDLATANATGLPTNTPGSFTAPNLAGDINGDGFVGIDDLNILLATWNNGTAPAPSAPSIPEPASLALLGIGGLAMLRRRTA